MSKTKFRGFFNKYHKKMPLLEIVLKDINYLTISIHNFIKNSFNNKSILVYPHYPSRRSTIYKVSKILGYNVTNKLKSNVKFAIYWEYLTFREEYNYLEELNKKMKIINLFSRDISKKYIDNIHKKVFGYSTIINPKIYKGKIVRKNDINAKHDGIIMSAPISSFDEDYIYQILIDNSFSDNLVMDIRVPIVGKVLDFVYIKYRDISERFKNTTTTTEIKQSKDIFNQKEIELLNQYCKALNLEYGELDVLRNKDDNKIYVVDVNNTPQGPPKNIKQEDGKFALNKISEALNKYININS